MPPQTLARLLFGWAFVIALIAGLVLAAKSSAPQAALYLLLGVVVGWGVQECLKPGSAKRAG